MGGIWLLLDVRFVVIVNLGTNVGGAGVPTEGVRLAISLKRLSKSGVDVGAHLSRRVVGACVFEFTSHFYGSGVGCCFDTVVISRFRLACADGGDQWI